MSHWPSFEVRPIGINYFNLITEIERVSLREFCTGWIHEAYSTPDFTEFLQCILSKAL